MRKAMITARWKVRGHGLQATLLPSRRRFLEYLKTKKQGRKRMSGAGAAAYFVEYKIGPVLGEVVFYPDYFEPDIIAHELAHFCIALSHKLEEDPFMNEEDEEEYTTTLQQCMIEVLNWKDSIKKHPPI